MTSASLANAPGERQEHHPRLPFSPLWAVKFVSLTATAEQDTPPGSVYSPPPERGSVNAFEALPLHRQPLVASIGSHSRSGNTALSYLLTLLVLSHFVTDPIFFLA